MFGYTTTVLNSILSFLKYLIYTYISLGKRDKDRTRRKSSRTGGRICDWEMMLLGRLFCRLSVVISAQVTWNPVIRWWAATLDTRHRKLPVMLPSVMEKEAVRFSGLAKTFGCDGAAQKGEKSPGGTRWDQVEFTAFSQAPDVTAELGAGRRYSRSSRNQIRCGRSFEVG